jgi:3-oxosteroid 1-dehydrogenase
VTLTELEVDVIAIGSGGGGLAAGLAATEAGGRALVIEKRDLVGGSTAMSGGVVWLPNNPLMEDEGVADSDEAGLEYFASVVGDVGPASSAERRAAYLSSGRRLVRLLQRCGVRFVRCPGYSDYYPDHPGGNAEGRSIEPAPFDGRVLGDWFPRLQPGMAAGLGLAVKTNELRIVQHYNRTLRTFVATGRVWLRTVVSRLLGRKLLTNGTGLVATMLKAALDRGVEVWTGCPVTELVVESGRVVGVRAMREGVSVLVRARHGVVIAAGGFAHNSAMRQEYGGTQAVSGALSQANPGDTGEVLRAAMALGAATALLDEAWWLPGPDPALATSTFGQARQRAGSVIVDAGGRRFVNESNSYVEVGKAMFARNVTTPAVPSWLVFDDAYRRRYAHSKSLPGRLDPRWLESGLLKRADSLEELAALCGIDQDGLTATLAKFNVHAARGVDPEFSRGASAYNRCLGDPGHRPNPCLAPIAHAPFYATPLYPRDVGTCGGLLTDEHARVLDAGGHPIAGLYATGNSTATIMGRHYLGAGASIGYSMAFGYIGGRHAMTAMKPVAEEAA